jgi:hypothetical protein
MNIEKIEDGIMNLSESKYISIIELIINATRDYPLYNLIDTDLYLNHVRSMLAEPLSINSLEKFILTNSFNKQENNIWIISSLNSLLEAFKLMELYNISFDEILIVINGMDK